MRLDTQTLTAALLHDVMEDTHVSKAEISDRFGKPVAELVDGVSKLDKIEFQTHADAQAENFRKMLLAMARDVRVILIKLADRLHNMRTLEAMRPEKRRRIARETHGNLRADRQPAGTQQYLPGTAGSQLPLSLSDALPGSGAMRPRRRGETAAKSSPKSSTPSSSV